MDIIERIENKEIAVIVLDVSDYKREGKVTAHDVYTREIMRLAKIGQQMQWVSVKERLPKPNDMVLMAFNRGGQWHITESNAKYGLKAYNPDYWMQLPPLPDTGEGS